VALVDSAHAVARDVEALLARTRLARDPQVTGARRFCVTDAPERAGEVAARFWGGSLPAMEHVDVMVSPL
jgi:glutamate racemase